jgi:hypothetical protein
MLGVFMLCETVQGHMWREDDGESRGGVLLFELVIIIAIVAFWVWLFQMMDGPSYMPWNAMPPIACAAPVPPPQPVCPASIRISIADLKGVISKEVSRKVRSELKRFRHHGSQA